MPSTIGNVMRLLRAAHKNHNVKMTEGFSSRWTERFTDFLSVLCAESLELNDRQRAVCYLYFCFALPHDDIAARLKLSPREVKRDLYGSAQLIADVVELETVL